MKTSSFSVNKESCYGLLTSIHLRHLRDRVVAIVLKSYYHHAHQKVLLGQFQDVLHVLQNSLKHRAIALIKDYKLGEMAE